MWVLAVVGIGISAARRTAWSAWFWSGSRRAPERVHHHVTITPLSSQLSPIGRRGDRHVEGPQVSVPSPSLGSDRPSQLTVIVT